MFIKWKEIPMADGKTNVGVPGQSALYIGLCLIGVLIFVLGGILPAAMAMKSLDLQTLLVRQKLQEQRTLLPYLQVMKAEASRKSSQGNILQQKGKLPRSEIASLSFIIADKAKKSGMTIVSVAPRLAELSGESAFLPVEVVLQGKYSDFRVFLINIGELNFLDKIDELAIQQNRDGKEYSLTLLIAVG
jgi:Tfp pilus assembly protein PilO